MRPVKPRAARIAPQIASDPEFENRTRSTSTGPLPFPLYMARGAGSRVWDADGHEFIDYLLSYGSVVLGHAVPALTDAVSRQLALGTMFGTCNTVEVELAEQITRMVPGADLVRFSNSGSEAICGAIRAARGFTGRTRILKFEGHYHGWVDVLAISIVIHRPGTLRVARKLKRMLDLRYSPVAAEPAAADPACHSTEALHV